MEPAGGPAWLSGSSSYASVIGAAYSTLTRATKPPGTSPVTGRRRKQCLGPRSYASGRSGRSTPFCLADVIPPWTIRLGRDGHGIRRVSVKKTERTNLKIVLLANLRPQKDHVTFVEALIYLKAHVIEKDIKVVFAGLYWDDPYFHSIKNVLESHDLIDRVDFVGSVNDVMSLLMDCDIGVLSSTSEGLPVSLLEYGQAGLPVIVTDVGQCAEVVDYGKAGLVVPPADSKAFSEALLDLIQHPEKRVHLGSTLQQRIEKEYGAQKFFEEYSKLIG